MTQPQLPTRRFWLSGKRAAEQDRFFREALEPLGWVPGDEHDWDAAWVTGMPDPAQFRGVSARRKLNHFPGNAALTVKSRLHDSLASLRDRIHESCGVDSEAARRLAFFPRAYALLRDYHALQAAAAEDAERRWILKPTNASKGKGVRVLRDVAEAPLAPNWMVQEYLAHPHTIRGHKYVLRLYVLISSLTPLRVYLYRQGFAKLASEPWDPEDADNPYSQLTNPDVNARNDQAEVPVEFIDLERYRAWLRDQGHDDAALFARLEDLVALTAIAGVDAMRQRTAEAGADARGCYELLGLDCLVDDDLKPWILECNLSPSLGICAAPEHGGEVEEAVKGGLVHDLVRLVDIPGEAVSEADEGDGLSPLAEAEAELARAGGFRRLLPSARPEHYLPFFSLPTLEDIRLAEGVAGRSLPRPVLAPRRVVELFHDEAMALHDLRSGRYFRPNDAATLVWLLATEGLDPDAIAARLDEAMTSSAEAPREMVWRTLGSWCRDGLLVQRGHMDPTSYLLPEEEAPTTSPRLLKLEVDNLSWALSISDAAARERLHLAFDGCLAPLDQVAAAGLPRLSILQEPGGGYALANERDLLATRLSLTRLVARLGGELLRQAARPGRPVIDLPLVVTPEGHGELWLTPVAGDGLPEALEERLARSPHDRVCRGIRMSLTDRSRIECLGVPLAAVEEGARASACEVVVTARLGEVAFLDALGLLLRHVITVDGDPLQAEEVRDLGAWLERVSAFSESNQQPDPMVVDG